MPRHVQRKMLNMLATVICIFVLGGTLVVYGTRREHSEIDDIIGESAVTILLPEPDRLRMSILRHFRDELYDWIGEYEETSGRSVNIIVAPYDPEGRLYDQKLLVLNLAGTEPDVIFVAYDRLIPLVEQDWILPMDGFAIECPQRSPRTDADVPPKPGCYGIPHHAWPDFHYAVLRTTPHPDDAVALINFLSNKGIGVAP